jgi:hypothetical protein
MSPTRFCSRCGELLWVDEHGERRCRNAHVQPTEARLLDALTQLVPMLLALRESFEGKVVPELRSLRQEVEALRDQPTAPAGELVDLATMARKLDVSDDWLRRHARELGGKQSKQGGRWKFHPPLTMALFGRREDTPPTPHPAPPRARPLPDQVPLLPVKDEA